MAAIGSRLHLPPGSSRWVDVPLRRKALAVVAPPLAGLCLATLAFLAAARQNHDSRKTVERSVAVSTQLRTVLGLAIDAETAARGFVLTGEDRFLGPYRAARIALPAALDRLEGGLNDRAVIEQLRALIDRRLQISEELVGRRVTTIPPETVSLLDEGRMVSDEIRSRAARVEANEQRTSQRSRSRAERAETIGWVAVAGGLALGLSGSLGGAALFARGVTDRIGQLLAHAGDLAAGRPVEAALPGSDEVAALGSALSQASELLRQRERALQESEAFLLRLLESAPTVVLRVGLPALDCTYVSPNAQRVFGIAAAPDGKFLQKRLSSKHLAVLQSAAGELARAERSARCELLFRVGDADERWVSVVLVRESDEPESAPTALVYLRDDDERHRAQHEVKEREATLQAVLDASPDMIAILDNNGIVTLANPAVERVLGWPPARMLGRNPFDWLEPADQAAAWRTFEALLAGTESHGILTYRALHADGHVVALESHASALLDSNGEAIGAVTVTRDVSERVRIADMQVAARDAAEQANRSKSEFVSRMSHELRTPLNAVIGFAQLLELDELTDEQKESVTYILKGGRHLLALIDDILDIARIETGKLKLSAEAVPLAGVFDDVIDMVSALADRVDVEIVDPAVHPELHVFADRQRLVQVLLNLCSNAIKYNRPRGTVHLVCEPIDRDWLSIQVTDTGRGIRFEDLSRLFVPFDRLGAEQTGIEGTGIGLALSRQLVEAMGGSLDVKTEFGQGSTFSVVLPQAEGPMERYERLNGDVEPSPIPLTGGTVLHIEDNLSNLKLVEMILARHGPMDVVATMQGRLGLELAREHHPRVVLLDLHLPDIGGDEVLRQLRQDPLTRDIPVIIASADATRGEVQRLLRAGAAAYITKPIDVPTLLRTLKEVLDGQPGD